MATLSSGLPEIISDEEPISRFLTQSSHYNSKMAKPAAFLPSPAARETSVSRHGSEPAERLWILGRLAAGERNLHGVAIFDAKVKRTANLDILAAEPPEYHAAIRGWFWNPEDLALQKARQLSAAQVLASHATLWRSPEGAVAT